jgi:hypothetical protein
VHEFADRFDAALADVDRAGLVDLQGEEGKASAWTAPAVSSPPPSPPPHSAANLEPVPHPDPSSEPPAHPRASPGPEAADLQLDFAAAGLKSPIKGQAMPGRGSALPPPADPPQATRLPAASPIPTGARPGDGHAGAERVGLLGRDRVAAGLLAAAIALAVAILPALQAARRLLRDDTGALLAELEDVVDRPLAVRAGDVRSPAAIASEIEQAYGAAGARYWTAWLSVAVPLGVVLTLLRRRA